jgi:hypothetical protein
MIVSVPFLKLKISACFSKVKEIRIAFLLERARLKRKDQLQGGLLGHYLEDL